MKGIGILPSLLTLGNAFCGFLAIAKVADALLYAYGTGPAADPAAFFKGKLVAACWLVLLAMVFDALDGKVARLANAQSEFGAQLDSLADAISFGVAPAFLVKVLVEHEVRRGGLTPHPRLYLLVAAWFALCAVLRLARFNVENDPAPEAHERFTGLPSPAAAGVVVSLVLLYCKFPRSPRIENLLPAFDATFVQSAVRRAFPVLLPVLGVPMISRLRYAHLLNWILQDRKAFPFLAEVLVVLLFLMVEPEMTLALGFLSFAMTGPLAAVGRRAFAWLRPERRATASS